LLARKISGKQAEAFGIVHAAVPAGQVMAVAREWAAKMLESGPLALRQAKAAIRMGADRTLEHGLQLEIDAYKQLLPSRDRQEGLKAFVEKRKPSYRGE
jgi:methylglutaconyl-CoA hydratase